MNETLPQTCSDAEAIEALFEKFVASELPEMAARILVVALELFAQKGYAATSVREIVQKAQVTNPMLYYYFDNKEGVFSKLIELLFDSMRAQLEEVITQDSTLCEKLEGITRVHFEGCRTLPIVYQFIYAALFGPKLARPNLSILPRHSAHVGSMVAMFEEAISTGEFTPHSDFSSIFITEQFFGLVNNYTMRALKLSEGYECAHANEQFLSAELSEQAIKKFVRFFLCGAGTIHG